MWDVLVHGLLGFGAGYTLERYGEYRLAKKRLSLLRHVFPFDAINESALLLNYLSLGRAPIEKPRVSVNCSRISKVEGLAEPSSLRQYVHSAEAIALIKVTDALHACSVELDVSQFYDYPTEAKSHLLIGSNAHNELSKKLLSDLGHMKYVPNSAGHSHFLYKNEPMICNHEDTKVTRDYGVIVRRSYHGNQWKLLLAGIHMHGTLAAAEVSLLEEFQERVRASGLKCFAQLVEIEVAPDGLGVPIDQVKWKNFDLVELKPI